MYACRVYYPCVIFYTRHQVCPIIFIFGVKKKKKKTNIISYKDFGAPNLVLEILSDIDDLITDPLYFIKVRGDLIIKQKKFPKSTVFSSYGNINTQVIITD